LALNLQKQVYLLRQTFIYFVFVNQLHCKQSNDSGKHRIRIRPPRPRPRSLQLLLPAPAYWVQSRTARRHDGGDVPRRLAAAGWVIYGVDGHAGGRGEAGGGDCGGGGGECECGGGVSDEGNDLEGEGECGGDAFVG